MPIEEGLFKKLTAISYSLTIASIIVILITSGSAGKKEINALQYSYIILAVSMLFMLGLLSTVINDTSIKSKIITLFPFILIAGNSAGIALMLYLFLDNILNGVSDYYSMFLNSSTMITIVLIWMMYRAVNDTYFMENKAINPKTFSLMMLLGTLNLITVITLGVVLKNYSTEGFII